MVKSGVWKELKKVWKNETWDQRIGVAAFSFPLVALSPFVIFCLSGVIKSLKGPKLVLANNGFSYNKHFYGWGEVISVGVVKHVVTSLMSSSVSDHTVVFKLTRNREIKLNVWEVQITAGDLLRLINKYKQIYVPTSFELNSPNKAIEEHNRFIKSIDQSIMRNTSTYLDDWRKELCRQGAQSAIR